MKICSLYGVGYYYIPGTDTCIKIGGYVRYEAYHNAPGGAYPTLTSAGVFTRHTNTFAQQGRFRLTTDVRTQTEYGTLRSYFAFGLNWLNQPNEPYGAAAAAPAGGVGFTGNLTASLERAFIQFAGFTIGRADTFFAFYNGAAYGLVPLAFDGSSGPGGLNVFAYTWQLGNGLSASLSAEDAGQYSQAVVDISNAQNNDIKGQSDPEYRRRTCVSIRLGVRPRSWARFTRSVRVTMAPVLPIAVAARRRMLPAGNYTQRSRVGLGGRCRPDLEDAVGCQGHLVRRDRLR